MFRTLVALLVLLGMSVSGRASGCYTTDPDPYRFYAEKTAYDTVRSQEQEQEETIPGCEAVGLWFLTRHGTRHTELTLVDAMDEWFPEMRADINDSHNNGRGELCAEDLAGLNSWDSPMPDDEDGTQAERGWRELIEMGERYTIRFPGLLDAEYNPEKFVFRHSVQVTNRTKNTAEAFAQGIFGTYDGIDLIASPQPDTLIRFYAFCDKYDELVGDHPVVERDNFIAGPEMAETLRRMAERAGQNEGYFDYESAFLIYESCRVEYGLYGEAPFCALFTKRDLEVMEYVEDLRLYYRESYPYDINADMSCEVTTDFMDYFRAHIEGGSAPSLLSRFGHQPTTDSFFTSLGLFKPDEHLTAENFEEQSDRPFMVSQNIPMGSNIAMALYSCDDGNYRVKTFVNEFPTEIPGCPLDEYDSCSYDDLAALFQERADTCDFDEICTVE